jgi:glyoxylase-like metal-dependent hydrolase (beta-lactamase superfamily II)/predicted ester cyclase
MAQSRTEAPAAPLRRRRSKADTEKVARAYFDAIARRDLDAAVAVWAPGGRENVRGQIDTTAPEGVRAFLGGLWAAFPDLDFEVVSTTAEGDRCAVQWRARGTFAGPEPFGGIEPTGARVELEGVDILRVDAGRIVENNAFSDGMTLARQVGMMPQQGSSGEQRLLGAFNLKTRLTRRLEGHRADPIAEGVWIVRGGAPLRTMNVYLLRDGDGVMLFDAGIRSMTRLVARAGASLGGVTRVLLGHGHPDHRGTAAGLGVPVLCHPAERADAEGDGGVHYFDYSQLNRAGQLVFPRLLASWDGGPVKISDTVEEGDEIAGFRVVHIPGHAPGLIALWREADRLALTSDCFYTIDPQTSRKGPPRVPLSAFNLDTEQARQSIRKIASLEPDAAWPGHADPILGDVREQLERAAAS